MSEPARRRVILAALIFVAACVFLIGINWGLPSRAIDKYLFGDEPVWSGEKILSLAPTDENELGADVDANPLAKKTYPIVLNDTDEKRAEIIWCVKSDIIRHRIFYEESAARWLDT